MKRTLLLFAALFITIPYLSGCGTVQKISNSSQDLYKNVFHKNLTQLLFDFHGERHLNPISEQLSSSLMIRIYQLTDKTQFLSMDYHDLLEEKTQNLGSELLDIQEVILQPEANLRFDKPLQNEANYIVIVGFFRATDLSNQNWRIVLQRNQIKPKKPIKITAIRNYLQYSLK